VASVRERDVPSGRIRDVDPARSGVDDRPGKVAWQFLEGAGRARDDGAVGGCSGDRPRIGEIKSEPPAISAAMS
jgi:hypothetical protein